MARLTWQSGRNYSAQLQRLSRPGIVEMKNASRSSTGVWGKALWRHLRAGDGVRTQDSLRRRHNFLGFIL